MAIRAAIWDKTVSKDMSVVAATWSGLTQSSTDTGEPVQFAAWSDKTFQAFGVFGASGAVLIEGSNDGTNWSPLSNRQGSAMSFTAAGMNTSQDRPVWVRPRVTNGDGTTNLSVIVACHRTDLAIVG